MLASWFHFTQQGWHVVIHDDGSLCDDATRTLRRMFPGARIIPRAEADAALERSLIPYPFCLDYRRTHPLALKIFDMPHFAEGDRFLIIDSDVLFFQRPGEVINWTRAGTDDCWFNEDVEEGTLVSPDEAFAELGVKLWRRVNSGLCLLFKQALDFDFCDCALAQTSILRGHVWRIEQTLFALCASRHGKGGLLPGDYEVSLKKHASAGVIARHYVGAVRDRFYGEGLKRLRNELFVEME
jgi:hypothetical protein